jgi:hypothetical protein
MSTSDATVVRKPKDVSAWKKAGVHDVALPSGALVTIKIPNLPEMVKNGSIPNNLLDAAIGAIQKETITRELIAEQADFFSLLVTTMVVEPAIDAADVTELPYEDIELLVEIGTRQRDLDALGNHISGLHRSAEWRRFRGLDYGD